MTKSSISPDMVLFGISQMPTRGLLFMIVPVGLGEVGAWILAFRSLSVTACQRAFKSSFASTRIPTASRPCLLISRVIESSNLSMFSFSEMQKVGLSWWRSWRWRMTCLSSCPSTKRMRSDDGEGKLAISYRTSMPCSATIWSSSSEYSTA